MCTYAKRGTRSTNVAGNEYLCHYTKKHQGVDREPGSIYILYSSRTAGVMMLSTIKRHPCTHTHTHAHAHAHTLENEEV